MGLKTRQPEEEAIMSANIITMEDFKAAATGAEQAAQFVRRPVTVTVHWSESGAWQRAGRGLCRF